METKERVETKRSSDSYSTDEREIAVDRSKKAPNSIVRNHKPQSFLRRGELQRDGRRRK